MSSNSLLSELKLESLFSTDSLLTASNDRVASLTGAPESASSMRREFKLTSFAIPLSN